MSRLRMSADTATLCRGLVSHDCALDTREARQIPTRPMAVRDDDQSHSITRTLNFASRYAPVGMRRHSTSTCRPVLPSELTHFTTLQAVGTSPAKGVTCTFSE